MEQHEAKNFEAVTDRDEPVKEVKEPEYDNQEHDCKADTEEGHCDHPSHKQS